LVLLYQWLLKSGDFYFGDLGILRTAVTVMKKMFAGESFCALFIACDWPGCPHR